MFRRRAAASSMSAGPAASSATAGETHPFTVVKNGYSMPEVAAFVGQVGSDIGAITPQDLRRVSFSVARRGYDKAEVIAYLNRVAAEVEAEVELARRIAREDRIAQRAGVDRDVVSAHGEVQAPEASRPVADDATPSAATSIHPRPPSHDEPEQFAFVFEPVPTTPPERTDDLDGDDGAVAPDPAEVDATVATAFDPEERERAMARVVWLDDADHSDVPAADAKASSTTPIADAVEEASAALAAAEPIDAPTPDNALDETELDDSELENNELENNELENNELDDLAPFASFAEIADRMSPPATADGPAAPPDPEPEPEREAEPEPEPAPEPEPEPEPIRATAPAPTGVAASPADLRRAGDEIAELLRDAHDNAYRLKTQADADVRRTVESAQAEVDAERRRQMDELARDRAAAERETDALVHDARLEAQRIRHDAERDAIEMRTAANAILTQAKVEVQAIQARARHNYAEIEAARADAIEEARQMLSLGRGMIETVIDLDRECGERLAQSEQRIDEILRLTVT